MKQNPLRYFAVFSLFFVLIFATSPILAQDEEDQSSPFIVNATDMDVDGDCTIEHCNLYEAINAANDDGIPSVIELNQWGYYEVSYLDNVSSDETILPTIYTEMTINGNGAYISRQYESTGARFFNIEASGNLILNDLTLNNGGTDYLYSIVIELGGAILNYGTLTLNNSTIRNSLATDGGGLANLGQATINYSTVERNAANGGGGIYNTGTLTISNSTISNNTGEFDAGGLYNYGTAILINTTVTYNIIYLEGSGGGGIYNGEDAELSLVHTTIAHNDGFGGGGIANYNGVVNLKNSLIVENGSWLDCSTWNDAFIVIEGVNFDSDSSCSDWIADGAGDLFTEVNIGIGELTYNGGPTLTIALEESSPARNAVTDCTDLAGVAITQDQRGSVRPASGSCDVGAFELDLGQTPPTYTVNTTDMINDGACGETHCSLNEAIIAANRDTLASTINLGTSTTYTLTEAISTFNGGLALYSIYTPIVINGNGSTITRSTDAETPNFRIFEVTSSGFFTLNDLTISNGYIVGVTNLGGGGAIRSEGALTLNNVDLLNNFADDKGGAILNANGILEINGGSLVGNESDFTGGAIDSCGGSIIIEDTLIENNSASAYGGAVSHGCGSQGVTLTNVTFRNNSSEQWGGALFVGGGSRLRIDGGLFDTNISGEYGGAINTRVETVITGATFTNNEAVSGGAINSSGLIIVEDSTFDTNTVPVYGGAIDASGSTTIRRSTLFNNEAVSGGAIHNTGIMHIQDSLFDNNSTDGGAGGAIASFRVDSVGTTLNIYGSSFVNNATTVALGGSGSAIYIGNGTSTITNSTFANNSAIRSGTIYYAQTSAYLLKLNNVTIANNLSAEGYGGVYVESGNLFVNNSIITNNGTNCYSNPPASTISAELGTNGNNIQFGDSSCGGDFLTTNPNLAGLTTTLQLEAGTTTTLPYFPFVGSSPAIEGGDSITCESTDQHGTSRPIGLKCDIGAFEANLTLLITSVTIPAEADFLPYTPINVTFAVTDTENAAQLSYEVICENGNTTLGVIDLSSGSAQGNATCTVESTEVATSRVTVRVYQGASGAPTTRNASKTSEQFNLREIGDEDYEK